VSGKLKAPATLPPDKVPDIILIGGWVGPRSGLDDMEKRKFLTLPGLELQPLGRPALSRIILRNELFTKRIRMIKT
jgi:hypothetical protein